MTQRREELIRKIAYEIFLSHRRAGTSHSAHEDWLEAEIMYTQAVEDGATEVDIHTPEGWFSTVTIDG